MAGQVLYELQRKLQDRLATSSTSLSAFALFRKMAAARPGQGVHLNGFQMALKDLKVEASAEDIVRAYERMSAGSGVNGILYRQFVESLGKNMSQVTATGRYKSNSAKATGRSQQQPTDPLQSFRLPVPSSRPSALEKLSVRSSRTPKTDVLQTIMIAGGHQFKLFEILKLLQEKIVGRNPGTAGERRCWKQFRALAGARKPGVVFKHELAKALKHYGVPLSPADFDTFHTYVDLKQDGPIDYDEWKEQIMGIKNGNNMNVSMVKERPKRTFVPFAPMELEAGERNPMDVFILLRAKMAMHQRGAPLAKKSTWKQFRIKSGASAKGVKPADFALVMKYYGMPMTREKSDYIFNIVDLKQDGIIDYDEFISVVLGTLPEWKPVEGTLQAPKKYDDSIDTFRSRLPGSPPLPKPTVGNLPIEAEKSDPIVALDEDGGSTMVPPLDLQREMNVSLESQKPRASNDTKTSVMAKLGSITMTNWRELQAAFRRADSKRSGILTKLDFVGVLADFDVALDASELQLIQNEYSGGKNLSRTSSSFHRSLSSNSFSRGTSRLLKGPGVNYSALLKDVVLGSSHLGQKGNRLLLRSISSSGQRSNTPSRLRGYINGSTKMPPLTGAGKARIRNDGFGLLQMDPDITSLLKEDE